MVKIDDSVNLHSKVYIYKDIEHIKYLSNYLNTIPYELICGVSKRVARVYKSWNKFISTFILNCITF